MYFYFLQVLFFNSLIIYECVAFFSQMCSDFCSLHFLLLIWFCLSNLEYRNIFFSLSLCICNIIALITSSIYFENYLRQWSNFYFIHQHNLEKSRKGNPLYLIHKFIFQLFISSVPALLLLSFIFTFNFFKFIEM